jgi:hypothetical protein
MKKKRDIFFRLLVTLLFAFACTYTLFDKVREVDLFSRKKYEDQDLNDIHAVNGNRLDGVLVSVTLFSPFRDTSYEFLPGNFTRTTQLVTTFMVLRC